MVNPQYFYFSLEEYQKLGDKLSCALIEIKELEDGFVLPIISITVIHQPHVSSLELHLYHFILTTFL